MNTAGSLAKDVGIKNACDALVIPRASFYRWCDSDKHSTKDNCRPVPPLSLTANERKGVLNILHEDQFVDQAPREVYSALLDGGIYMCSVRTMYRILEENQEVRERRNQLR
ncbi:MAG: IS3 family transposase, partial [Proteobacteria bacterium]|nr:IS3 family transposase [Pseudomonadota bacterium]